MENAVRIIPCLDIQKGRVVKGVHFVGLRDMGDPVELANRYEEQGADELVFLDISASEERRETQIQWVKDVARNLRIPFTVGGGVSSIQEAEVLLQNGVDKVAVNSAAFRKPKLVAELAQKMGSQSVVVAIDVKRNGNRWEVFSQGGKVATGKEVLDWVRSMENAGAGELLITSMDGDGSRQGFDVELYAAVRSVSQLPIIASGGAGSLVHFSDVALRGGVDAVLAASLFHENELTIQELKDYFSNLNIACRIN